MAKKKDGPASSGPQPSDLARAFLRIFEGYHGAYGTYDASAVRFNDSKGGKVEIKATADTKRAEVTAALWQSHLDGQKPLGIIPIRDNNTCLWGVIDVDEYGTEHADLCRQLAERELPLVVCRSKSGGAHLFLFMAEPVPARLIQLRLHEIAALMGYGQSEVFPKQQVVLTARGDLGSWLNMPYFGGDDTERYGYDRDGERLSAQDFVLYAESLQQPAVWIEGLREKPRPGSKRAAGEAAPGGDEFGDGPPCMGHLSEHGIPEGTRNKGLYAFSIFAKKKFGMRWTEVVERWNREFFVPPLPSSEVLDIIRQVEKKDYNYPCREHPLRSHCNSALCRTRDYGVGGDNQYPVVSGISVLDTEPPIWFVEVSGERLEVSTEELMNYRMFQKVCLERLHIFFQGMKQPDWQQVVANEIERSLNRIEVSQEVGLGGQFQEILEEYVLNRHRARARDEILGGKPWHDEEGKPPAHYFRLKDLMKFLDQANFKNFSRGQVTTRLKALGGGPHFFNIQGVGVNVWSVPSAALSRATPELPLPAFQKDPI